MTEIYPHDLNRVVDAVERVRDLVNYIGARVLVEVWDRDDTNSIAWIEMHPLDTDPTIRFTKEAGR